MQPTTQEPLLDVHARFTRAIDLPAFKEFASQLSDVLGDSHENFWKCRNAFALLSRSRAALGYIESELLNALQSTCYVPKFTLVECDLFSLRLLVVLPRPAPRVIRSMVEHQMLAVIQGSVQLQRFERPNRGAQDVFNDQKRIFSKGVSTLVAGDVAALCADRECYELSTCTNAFLFQLRSRPLYRLQWVYDAATLAPKRIYSSHAEDMQAELAILTARNLGFPDCVPNVRRLLDHPNHVIRRAALDTLLALDPENRDVYLRVAANDPHPDVQQAALYPVPPSKGCEPWH